MVAQFPAVHARAHLVLLLKGGRTDVGSHQIGISLVDPNGHLQLDHRVMMQISEPPAGVTELEAPGLAVLDLPLPVPGRYSIVISVDGIEMERIRFAATLPPNHHGNGMH